MSTSGPVLGLLAGPFISGLLYALRWTARHLTRHARTRTRRNR